MKNLLALLILALAAAAAMSFFVSGLERDATTAVANGTAPGAEYDYFVEAMQATRFGADGAPLSELRAARVTHFPADDRAELITPAYASFGTGSDAWRVSAATGTLRPEPSRGEDRLDLAGKVELRKPLANGDFFEVDTEALTVFVDTEEAYSDVAVVARTRTSRLSGNGMQVRLAENQFQLTDGSGTHVPASNP